jgi:hypothetical protein
LASGTLSSIDLFAVGSKLAPRLVIDKLSFPT